MTGVPNSHTNHQRSTPEDLLTKMHELCCEIQKFPDFDDLGIELVKVRSALLRDIERKANSLMNALLADWRATQPVLVPMGEGQFADIKGALEGAAALGRKSASSEKQAPPKPDLWWNGFRRYNERDGTYPSVSETEDTNHDIPLYSGWNAASATATVAATPKEAHKESLRQVLNELMETAADKKNSDDYIGKVFRARVAEVGLYLLWMFKGDPQERERTSERSERQ